MNVPYATTAGQTSLMLLADIAACSASVAAASARNQKTALLADLLAGLQPDEIEPCIGFLTAKPRQGRIGVGWATVSGLAVQPAENATLTAMELDELLTKLSQTTGDGSAASRRRLLTDLMGRATAPEHQIIRQILTGELRQGALAGVVTAAVAKAAGVKLAQLRRAVMLTGNLGVAGRLALTEGAGALAAVRLEVGRPIEPMLASTSESVADAIEAVGEASVEWKLDGARIQVHRNGSNVSIFTRNLNDVTDRLAGVVEVVSGLPVDQVVLDGEVLGLVADGSPQPFQDTMSTFSDESGTQPDAAVAMTPFFFDVMHVDGVDLIDAPLSERSAVLDRIAGDHRIPTIITADTDEAAAHSDRALAVGHEGVMVKGLDGGYEAGRRGKAWRKVKPVHTLDLVVLAAEWGHGRRTGSLSNLHLGARDEQNGQFVMVGKTFKGLTDELLAWQTEQFLQLKLRESASGHTVFVRPELVVEIAIDGVQRSTRYPGGVALRFARVKSYRPDRTPESIDTIASLQARLG